MKTGFGFMQNVRENSAIDLNSQYVATVMQMWSASVLCISGFKLGNTVWGLAIVLLLFCLPSILHLWIIYCMSEGDSTEAHLWHHHE